MHNGFYMILLLLRRPLPYIMVTEVDGNAVLSWNDIIGIKTVKLVDDGRVERIQMSLIGGGVWLC